MRFLQGSGFLEFGCTRRPLSSSFLGLPYRILKINHKKELLRGLWVGSRAEYITEAFSGLLTVVSEETGCLPDGLWV